MNFKEIKDLIKLLENTDITELSWENEGNKLTLKKGVAHMQPVLQTAPAYYPQPVHAPLNSIPGESSPEAVGGDKSKIEDDDRFTTVYAPMVGTFYRAPSPDAEPYVQIGQIVEIGQVLCIIEAMKLMNEIENEVRGKIVKILVENAQPVEYGQALFVIEKL
ncbi:MAG: acetyl-CoA carboxylase biotin carboxyl carrier protein [Bacillota bacterium]